MRVAQLMHVYTDKYEEYEERHRNISAEMKRTLKEYGASNYSIFLDKSTGNLFAYLEVEDIKQYNRISESAECQKWWKYMEDIMDTNDDNSPITIDLKEVFYLK